MSQTPYVMTRSCDGHCWHTIRTNVRGSKQWDDQKCCWCGASREVPYHKRRDPRHGHCVDLFIRISEEPTHA